MTLLEVQDTIMQFAWWIGDWDDPAFNADDHIRPEMRLRLDLRLNDEEILAMFGTTDVVTVSDCMALKTYTCDEFPF